MLFLKWSILKEYNIPEMNYYIFSIIGECRLMLLHFVTSLNSNFQFQTHFDLNPSIFPSFVSTMTLHFTSSTENAKTSKMINEFILPSVLLFCAAIPNKKLGNVKQNGKIK